eukprot:s1849_g5.t1
MTAKTVETDDFLLHFSFLPTAIPPCAMDPEWLRSCWPWMGTSALGVCGLLRLMEPWKTEQTSELARLMLRLVEGERLRRWGLSLSAAALVAGLYQQANVIADT